MSGWKVEHLGRQAGFLHTDMQESGPWDPSSETGPEEALPIRNLRQGSPCTLQAYPFTLMYGQHTTLSTSQWGSHPESLGSLDGSFSLRPGLPSLRHSLPSGGWPTLFKEGRQPKALGPWILSSGLAGLSKLAELVTAESRQ